MVNFDYYLNCAEFKGSPLFYSVTIIDIRCHFKIINTKMVQFIDQAKTVVYFFSFYLNSNLHAWNVNR